MIKINPKNNSKIKTKRRSRRSSPIISSKVRHLFLKKENFTPNSTIRLNRMSPINFNKRGANP